MYIKINTLFLERFKVSHKIKKKKNRKIANPRSVLVEGTNWGMKTIDLLKQLR
jgi:hypothetical protein